MTNRDKVAKISVIHVLKFHDTSDRIQCNVDGITNHEDFCLWRKRLHRPEAGKLSNTISSKVLLRKFGPGPRKC